MAPSPSPAEPSKIFISYRRSENAAHAGRLSDKLIEHFGPQVIFFDVDSIPPGQDFVEEIEDAFGACKILLVIIGRHWLTCSDARGRRLDAPNDYVRLEIATALKRGIKVIPVLVEDADMPGEADLPVEIAALARRQAWKVDDVRWHRDVRALIEKLAEEIPRSVPRPVPKHFFSPRESSKNFPFKPLTAAVILFAAAAAYFLWPRPVTRLFERPRPCTKSTAGESRYYEAEDADLSGGASKDSEHAGFSGDGFVSGYGVQPVVSTTFWVDVPSDGQYQVGLCYANGNNSERTLTIYVNEERVKQTFLESSTNRWNVWLTRTESLPLRAGRNAISYRKSVSDNGQVNLDFIGIVREPIIPASPSPTATPTPTVAPQTRAG
ncbi:MAG TPA: TIR domain-containing protein [Pyrinomonadaceae bacterium]|nr:TIR domain-containing protein [Pyrinomonadaceae bacterium]